MPPVPGTTKVLGVVWIFYRQVLVGSAAFMLRIGGLVKYLSKLIKKQGVRGL
jgi:hypothetical protein